MVSEPLQSMSNCSKYLLPTLIPSLTLRRMYHSPPFLSHYPADPITNGQLTKREHAHTSSGNRRFYSSSGQDSSSSSAGGSNGKWVALALLLGGVGGAGIAYQNGLLDKKTDGGDKKESDKKSAVKGQFISVIASKS